MADVGSVALTSIRLSQEVSRYCCLGRRPLSSKAPCTRAGGLNFSSNSVPKWLRQEFTIIQGVLIMFGARPLPPVIIPITGPWPQCLLMYSMCFTFTQHQSERRKVGTTSERSRLGLATSYIIQQFLRTKYTFLCSLMYIQADVHLLLSFAIE